VSCGCELEDLLAVLRDSAPAIVDLVALKRRRVEHGLLSVGLKVHHLGDGREFCVLVERLGGASRVLDMNRYRHAHASLCLVLPPLGNARAAIGLLEGIESFTGSALFGNRRIQIQVCSPGRLDARRSALLAIAFYLGSDTLRTYGQGDLETTFSRGRHNQWGERLVIYDAGGDFDRGFEWWERSGNGRDRLIRRPHLPFKNGRSDLLTGSGSRRDIDNVNLIATLLIHAQHRGYWSKLGERFEEDMQYLLDRHLLAGLIEAPWVVTDHSGGADDARFFSALQELVAYAFEESARLKKKSRMFVAPRREAAAAASPGILHEMQALLQMYRTEVRQSGLRDKGRCT
jgi:hypothetical protein